MNASWCMGLRLWEAACAAHHVAPDSPGAAHDQAWWDIWHKPIPHHGHTDRSAYSYDRGSMPEPSAWS